jgi:subtilisin family serine protease
MEREVIIVAAVGNDGDGHNAVVQPAACPGVLVVASVDRNQKPESFSQRQNYVGVAAPGSALGSVTPDSAEPRGYFQKNLRGTSYSAALVSGVVALLRAKGLSAPESLQRITYTAQDVGPRGHDRETGYGVIRPHEALTASIPANTPNSLYTNWERA